MDNSIKKIYIVTGEIHSGKTTSLLKWIEGRNDVYGFLTPAINGKRFFTDVSSKEQFAMEAGDDDANPLLIGKYKFNRASFDKAAGIVRDNLDKKGWLIIDEIGPLELQQKGFYEVMNEALASKNNDLRIVVVIREKLLEQVKDFFGFDKYHVQLMQLNKAGNSSL